MLGDTTPPTLHWGAQEEMPLRCTQNLATMLLLLTAVHHCCWLQLLLEALPKAKKKKKKEKILYCL
jgi:hypothetical protein